MSSLGSIIPFVQTQYFDNSGNPLNGGKLYFYVSGSGQTTPLDTYQDVGLTVANTNPLVLNSAGRPSVAIFFQPLSYEIVCTTSAGTQLWSVDGVPATGLSQSAVGVGAELHVFGGSEYTPVTATSYPSGTSYTACHADTSLLLIDSALLVGTFAVSAMLDSVGGATVTAALVNLSDGSPDTPLVTVASTSATGELVTSTAIPFAAGGTAKTYAIKTKVSANTGSAWGLRIVRTA